MSSPSSLHIFPVYLHTQVSHCTTHRTINARLTTSQLQAFHTLSDPTNNLWPLTTHSAPLFNPHIRRQRNSRGLSQHWWGSKPSLLCDPSTDRQIAVFYASLGKDRVHLWVIEVNSSLKDVLQMRVPIMCHRYRD